MTTQDTQAGPDAFRKVICLTYAKAAYCRRKNNLGIQIVFDNGTTEWLTQLDFNSKYQSVISMTFAMAMGFVERGMAIRRMSDENMTIFGFFNTKGKPTYLRNQFGFPGSKTGIPFQPTMEEMLAADWLVVDLQTEELKKAELYGTITGSPVR